MHDFEPHTQDPEFSAMEGDSLSSPEILELPTIYCQLLPIEDIPEGYIGYNPSGFHDYEVPKTGRRVLIVYVRVEQDRHNGTESHLGKTQNILHYIETDDSGNEFLRPLWKLAHETERSTMTSAQKDEAKESYTLLGEDASMQQIEVRHDNGEVTMQCLVSVVRVTTNEQAWSQSNPQNTGTYPGQDGGELASLQTVFYLADDLQNLQNHEIARGPEGMKDIRLIQCEDKKGFDVYGRPQGNDTSPLGNITYYHIESLAELNTPTLHDSLNSKHAIISETLFKEGEWGGVNDIIRLDDEHNLLLIHRARRTTKDGIESREYEAELHVHNTTTGDLTKIAVVGQYQSFENDNTSQAIAVKDHQDVNLKKVVFPGGFTNGVINHKDGLHWIEFSAGVADANTGYVTRIFSQDEWSVVEDACESELAA